MNAAAPAPSQRSPRLKIAFLKRQRFSHINAALRRQLTRCFPEYEVEEIDIFRDFLLRHPAVVLRNVAAVLRLYGWDILRGRRSFKLCFYRTPYLFHAIRRWLHRRLDPRLTEFAFSFATQSLYDASLVGLPHFVYTDHTHLANLSYPGFDRGQLFAQSWIDLELEIYAHASRIFVPGQHVARSLREQYHCPPEQAVIVPAGSNLPAGLPPLANDGYRNQTIVFVGLDWERKGGPELIEAFKFVREKLPAAQLLIIGTSPSITAPGVRLLGRQPVSKIPNLLATASLFCLPSRIEPFGIAVLEALACGLPAVVTRIGALPDLVSDGQSGYVVPPRDPQALAAALLELLTNPDRCRQFGAAGREYYQRHGSWDAAGDRLRKEIAPHLHHPITPKA